MPRPRTGTLTQRGPALWRLQVTSNADPGPGAELGAKRRLSRSFRGTKAEARAALQRLIVETGCDLHGGSTASVAVLLGQFITTASLAPTTRADWQCVVDNHLVPALGDIPLWRLTARDCDALYGALKDAGLGPSRVRCTHVVLHRTLAQAVRWGWLARNPASNATRPEVPRTTIHPPDAAAVRALIAQASTHDPDMACWATWPPPPAPVAATEGIDVRTVANRLGHARTSTTMDIYWAFVPARDRDAADHLEAILRPM